MTTQTETEQPVKRGRGRPKGSKNKPKTETATKPAKKKAPRKKAKAKAKVETPVETPAPIKKREGQVAAEARVAEVKRTAPKRERYKSSTIDQVLGSDGEDKYGTLDENVYEERIGNMDRADLFFHASQFNVTPNDNLVMLRKRLMSEFYKHAVKYKAQTSAVTVPRNRRRSTSIRLPDDVQKILDEGK